MKIIFIGCVELSSQMLRKLIGLKAHIIGVMTKEKSDFNADFVDLAGICSKKNIPYKYVNDINTRENLEWIKSLQPDIIFCFGFSQIIKKDILNSAPMGVIGFHPAKLPQNRGRHPLIWALALGLKETASTFFFMSEGIDDGDIVSQSKIVISKEDNARALYNKIVKSSLRQIKELLPRLDNGTYNRIPQNDAEANYWRLRNKEDGRIDFRMTSAAICNLVRALAKPYIGTHIIYKGKDIKVWEVKTKKVDLANIEHGKVLDIKNKSITVKCYDGAVILEKHEFRKLPKIGEYL
jgi:methionyl-tRNA formyltransferase